MASSVERYAKEYTAFITVPFAEPEVDDELDYILMHSDFTQDLAYGEGLLLLTCETEGASHTKGITIQPTPALFITSCTAYSNKPDTMCHISGNSDGYMHICLYEYNGLRDVTAIDMENVNVHVRITFKKLSE